MISLNLIIPGNNVNIIINININILIVFGKTMQ